MSFIEKLRIARSSKVAILHKFLTHYDPATRRIYAFVEGEPDGVFYRARLEAIYPTHQEIFIYNCDGKKKIFEALKAITEKYPECRRVLFFVDKDVDDLCGVTWPSDPRVFTTSCYSIENYVICRDAGIRYFRDFIKVRGPDIPLDAFPEELMIQRKALHRLLLPVMAWVIAHRRRHAKIMLSRLDLERIFIMNGTQIKRRVKRCAIVHLSSCNETPAIQASAREVLAVCRELARLDPSIYIRGHFEAWWFIKCIQRMCDDLSQAAKEVGGNISINAPLTERNFVQILTPSVPEIPALTAFLRFHLGERKRAPISTPNPLIGFLQKWF